MQPAMVIPSVVWMLLSCFILQYQVKGDDFLKELLSPRISCPKGSVAYGSYCYALFLSAKTWMAADLACQKRSEGRLVSVLTGSEAYFVSSMIRNTGTKSENIWIGLHDPTEGLQPNGGGWEWSSKDVLNYLAWEKDIPTHPDSGHCASVSETSNYEKWRDFDCRKELPYICKFKE
ncbi:lithostathine-like isoform X1 [Suncus etruscus]|uniref:lithostathine-like isoform X1 n=1 Tax=Suncus etruscus TaxID=109475 RepID=UPI00210F5662|nr:lithostathine-like isoform X1 [Suncus etruscus]